MSESHPTEIPVPEGEIVLMNAAGQAAVKALYVLFQRDKLGSQCAFLSIVQMALSRSKLNREDALAALSNVLAHNFGERYRIAIVPPDDGGDEQEPAAPAVH